MEFGYHVPRGNVNAGSVANPLHFRWDSAHFEGTYIASTGDGWKAPTPP
jgi:hypothetical protein